MPTIDIIIPVHNDRRPILRAVSSVVSSGVQGVSVLVICHNIDREVIRSNLGELASDPAVRLIELHDGTRSPAAPRNHGIAESTADYLGFLDSDDQIESGALGSWAAELSTGPDLLIGQLFLERSGRTLSPAPRVARFVKLDPVRDLLNYRTTLQGVLVRRKYLVSGGSPGFCEAFQIGEDIGVGLYIWNYARDIRYSRCAAGYLLREDGNDRVTSEVWSPQEVFAPVRDAVSLSVLTALSRRRRQAIAVKLLRRHLLEYLTAMHRSGQGSKEALQAAAEALVDIRKFGPGVVGYFNFSEARLIAAIAAADVEQFDAALARADSTPYQLKLVTRNPLRSLAPESFFVRSRRTRLIPAKLEEVGFSAS